jgi:CHAT domain-containing protein/tetratricopeptide (TPR) repeat protein
VTQDQKLDEEAQRLGGEGFDLLEAGSFEASLAPFESALAIWKRLERPEGQAAVLGKIARARSALGDDRAALRCLLEAAGLWKTVHEYDLALRELEEARVLQQRLLDSRGEGAVLNLLGEVYAARGDHGWALEQLKTALIAHRMQGDREGAARTLANLADIYIRSGNYNLAGEHLSEAVSLHSEEPRTQAAIQGALGVLNIRLARYEEAQASLSAAIALVESTTDREELGRLVSALGRTYLQMGRYAEAARSCERALEILRDGERPTQRGVYKGLRPLSAAALNDLGEAYLARGDAAGARGCFETALYALAMTTGPRKTIDAMTDRRLLQFEGTSRFNLGFAYFAEGRPGDALPQFRGALAIQEAMHDAAGEGRTLCEIARVSEALGQPQEAYDRFDEALAIQDKIGDRAGEITTLHRKAGLLRHDGRHAEALAALRRASSLLEDVRASLDAPANRMGFFSPHLAIYQDLIGILADLAQTPDAAFDLFDAGGDYASASLFYAEHAKARVFAELLARSKPASIQLRGALASEERLLLARQQAALRAFRDTAVNPRDALAAYRTATTELRSFIARLRESSEPAVRAYAALTYPQPSRAAEIQEALRADEMLVEFAVQPDRTLIWIVEPYRTRLVVAPLGSAAVRDYVGGVRGSLEEGTPMPETALEALFEALVAPALDGAGKATKLILAPDEALALLPFELLGHRHDGPWKYVADDWEPSYYPSGTLLTLARLQQQGPAAFGNLLLAFGDPDYAGTDFLRLDNSRQEVLWIADLLRVERTSEHIRLDERASESAVKELSRRGELATFRYIHFATHGVLSADEPDVGQPALVLSRAADTAEDGFLTMDEVFGLQLAADLVVLSACQTGLGEAVAGEGLVGLTRAFFHAGTRSAVVSLWRVDDESTSAFMVTLYDQLAKGADKGAALRQARAATRANFPDPYCWAPFILVGER